MNFHPGSLVTFSCTVLLSACQILPDKPPVTESHGAVPTAEGAMESLLNIAGVVNILGWVPFDEQYISRQTYLKGAKLLIPTQNLGRIEGAGLYRLQIGNSSHHI